MMKFRPLRLRTIFSLVMVGYVLVTVFIGYGGMNVYNFCREEELLASLSPSIRNTMAKVEKNQAPTIEEIKEIDLYNTALQKKLEQEQYIVLVILSLFAMGIAALVALYFSRRIAMPIEAVAVAARQVAGGNLNARALPKHKGAGETVQLVADFNRMAQSLVAFDQEYKENAAMIAHELRTPLTILRGRLQGMQDGLFDITPEAFRNLIYQVEGLGRIVEDLRIVSLSATGKLMIYPTPTDMAYEVRILLETVCKDLENEGFSVVSDLKSAPILGDGARIRQVGIALIENVRQHAREGMRISIETGIIDGFSFLTVKDRGSGLSDIALEHVFKRFWRAEASRSRAHGGSGLGLSVVEAIAKAHDGRVQAQNRHKGGAQFDVLIPTLK